jgi:polyhydroxyalkanoate synthase
MASVMNSLRSWYEHLSEVNEVDIATADREVVWQDGKVKLYHFSHDHEVKAKTPVIISYALVNRWEMMDLQPDRSIIRKMCSEGLDIYLIDWGYASLAERYKTMDDYINGDLDACVDFVRERHGVDKVNLLGVCQGGTFSLIYSASHPEKIKNLITLVTPVDFNVEDGLLFTWSRHMDVDALVDGYNGIIPGEFLNIAFDLLKPTSKMRKMINLPEVMKDKAKLMNYLRMEKWVSDSPDQAGETYRQFIKDLYQENKLIKGNLVVGEHTVDLKNIDMPVLTIYAKADHLVPPSATKPLNDLISSKDKELYEFPGGHIGVFVGRRSQQDLAPTIAKWLADRD